jgi:hypothetical protein
MRPILADGIDLPILLVAGVVVLVPLMTFEVFLEALVLKPIWPVPYTRLCGFTLFANLWSLLAGIPTKILNAFLYSRLLPDNIPGFFARYPFAAALGSLTYFAVTLLVEGFYACSWLRWKRINLGRGQIWGGILLANIASYIVLAPLHYYATRPRCDISEFTNGTRWSDHPGRRVVFTGGSDHYLKTARLDGSAGTTIVPMPVTDFLVSTNLAICLYRGTNGNLYLYRHDFGTNTLVWKTDERFFMNQVAFSPSGDRVAYASEKENSIEVVDLAAGKAGHLPLATKFEFSGSSVAWSPEEARFFVRGFENSVRLAVTILPDGQLLVSPLDNTNTPTLLTCYGRAGEARWFGADDWGVTFSRDECGELTASSWPGLDSSLMIDSEGQTTNRSRLLTISVRPGLLHLADFHFGDVAFLDGCRECLFEANGYLYLLDVNEKRLGTFVKGDRLVLLTPRYQKSF